MEVERDAYLVPQRDRLHRGDLQERRQHDVCERGLADLLRREGAILIDIREAEQIDEAALKKLIREAVALNLEGKKKA